MTGVSVQEGRLDCGRESRSEWEENWVVDGHCMAVQEVLNHEKRVHEEY